MPNLNVTFQASSSDADQSKISYLFLWTVCCRFVAALFEICKSVDLCQKPDIFLLIVDIMF
jgi:hypothetical protein